MVLIFLFSGCSTKKNTIVSRSYHNLTAHYNAYFNGREKIKSAVKTMNNSYKDDYTKVLPLFTYGDENLSKASFPAMDFSIKKASKVISMHSIKAKPNRKNRAQTKRQKAFMKQTEYCKWVDDSYLLMGKAHFYKRDFYPAEESFQFVISEYNTNPIKNKASLWLARNYNEQEKYDKSRQILELLDGDKKFPKKLKPELNSIYADYYLKQKKYADVIPYLTKATEKAKRKEKARYKFVLAQIYQNLGQKKKANELYKEVIALNPNYEMTFNAQINRASAYDASSSGARQMKKDLNKMLRDDKNKEYLDQVYYALGKILLSEGNESEAIKMFKLSTKNYVSNDNQKAISYLALGEIYFKKPLYVESQMYYDSAMLVLKKDYPDYEKIDLLTKNLTSLVKPLREIQYQDSMQTLAKMTANERNKIIDAKIAKLKEDEVKAQEELRQQQINSQLYNQNQASRPANGTTQSGTGWYFYNQSTLASGFGEFRQKWGTRKLEDNWRRKNKAFIETEMFSENAETKTETETTKKPKFDNKTREFYLANIPLSDSAMKASHKILVDAYYDAGSVYKEKFMDYPKAINLFEELNKRYAENIYIPTTYYYLYQLNIQTKNQTKADFYKNLILSKYPNSQYSKILLDPNYLNDSNKEQSQLERLYEKTYIAHKSEKYSEVIDNYNEAKKMSSFSKDVNYVPKFKFLYSIAMGKTISLDSLASGLNSVVKQYPESEITASAKDILAKMKSGNLSKIAFEDSKTTSDTTNQAIEKVEMYKFDEKAVQQVLIVFANKKIDVKRFEFDIINFNTDFFSMQDFNVNSLMLNNEYQLITVKSFVDLKQAKTYYETLLKQTELLKRLNGIKNEIFIISSDNYPTFYKDKDLIKYLEFFKKNYLGL